MKLSKQKLIEIIKEEMGSIESLSGVESDPEVTGEDEGVSSRSELGKKLIKLGKEIPKISDLDAAEAALVGIAGDLPHRPLLLLLLLLLAACLLLACC